MILLIVDDDFFRRLYPLNCRWNVVASISNVISLIEAKYANNVLPRVDDERCHDDVEHPNAKNQTASVLGVGNILSIGSNRQSLTAGRSRIERGRRFCILDHDQIIILPLEPGC